jgi:hypothetical protein
MRYDNGTLKGVGLAFCLAATLAAVGCGSGGESADLHQQEARQRAAREVRRSARAQRLHKVRLAEARELREAARRRARRIASSERAREASEALSEAEAEEASSEEAEANECDPNYSGACLDPYASDYDCEGGSGNGPDYTGTVSVVGVDHYGLDADGDGYGCE